MDEHTLGSAPFREDFYKVLATVLCFPVPLQAVPGYGSLPQSAKRRIDDNLAHVRDVITLMAHPGHGQVNPVHRPVIKQLMADLQALLDTMPAEEGEERPSAWELAEQSAQEAGARMAKEVRANVVEQSEALAKKTWMCPDHGIRPWRSKPGLLRSWCLKELADGTECGQELVERTKPVKAEAAFDSVQQATTQTKRLCRGANIAVVRVNSSYLPSGQAMQTIITLPDNTSDLDYAHLVAVLNDAGYTSIRVHTDTSFVSACSKLQGMFANA